jgi:prophage antirepressor-like protein
MNILTAFDYGLNNDVVRVYGTKEVPYFCGTDITKVLGYVDPQQAIRKNVDARDRIRLEDIGVVCETTLVNQPKLGLISESGLYSLVFGSNKPKAKEFKRFVTSVILPSIRMTGTYKQPEEKISLIQNRMKDLQMYTQVLEGCGGLDDRDRLFIKDLANNAMMSSGGQREIKDNNEEWSISRRMSEYYNITCKEAHRKLITFGKVLAKLYREIHGVEPPKRSQMVKGTLRNINCYYLSDWTEHFDLELEKFFSNYFSDYVEED